MTGYAIIIEGEGPLVLGVRSGASGLCRYRPVSRASRAPDARSDRVPPRHDSRARRGDPPADDGRDRHRRGCDLEVRALNLWARFREWAKRLDASVLQQDWRPQGLELAAPDVQSEILAKACQRRMWTRPPVVAPADDWLSQPDAAELLESRTAPLPHVGMLIARGLLQQAYRASDGADGVTRSSVEEELRWREEANLWRRIRRRVGGILHWI